MRKLSDRTCQLDPARWRQWTAARAARSTWPVIPDCFTTPARLLAGWGLAGDTQVVPPEGGYYWEAGGWRFAEALLEPCEYEDPEQFFKDEEVVT